MSDLLEKVGREPGVQGITFQRKEHIIQVNRSHLCDLEMLLEDSLISLLLEQSKTSGLRPTDESTEVHRPLPQARKSPKSMAMPRYKEDSTEDHFDKAAQPKSVWCHAPANPDPLGPGKV